MTIDVECPEHGSVPIELPGILIGTDRVGLFAVFVCPRCSIASGRRTGVFWTITPTIADALVQAGVRDFRHIGLAIRAQLADRQAVASPDRAARRPAHPVPPQAPACSRLDRELSDPARGYTNRITEDETIEFGRLLESLTYPAAFAARQMRGAAS